MIYNIGFSDYGWDDLRVPLTAAKIGTGSPPGFAQLIDDGAGSEGVFTYRFDKAAEEQVFFETQMPHDWQDGTTIYPHIHWCGVSTEMRVDPAIEVKWGLEYTITAILGTIGNTTIVTGSTPIGNSGGSITAFKHEITALGAGIDMSTFTGLSAVILGRVFREATSGDDNYNFDAAGLSIDFHYRRWRLGSTNPTSG